MKGEEEDAEGGEEEEEARRPRHQMASLEGGGVQAFVFRALAVPSAYSSWKRGAVLTRRRDEDRAGELEVCEEPGRGFLSHCRTCVGRAGWRCVWGVVACVGWPHHRNAKVQHSTAQRRAGQAHIHTPPSRGRWGWWVSKGEQGKETKQAQHPSTRRVCSCRHRPCNA